MSYDGEKSNCMLQKYHWGNMLEQPLTGREALTAFLSTLKSKDGNREIWLKLGHDRIYRAEFTDTGFINAHATKLVDGNRVKTKDIPDLTEYLLYQSQQKDGGVFYLPKQPLGAPLADNVASSDDIGLEMDEGTPEEQLERYRKFSEITGLQYSTLLSSGSKSIHGHIKSTEHLPIDQNIYLHRLCILPTLADPVTARAHQPMRTPCFYRKETGKEQSLLYYSDAQYSYDEILAGLQKYYDWWGVEMPPHIPDDWWSECFWKILKSPRTLDEKIIRIRKNLNAGVDLWEKSLDVKRILKHQKKELYEQRKQSVTTIQGESIVDLVRNTCEDLGADPFEAEEKHNWAYDHTGIKARGCCLWHDSGSGNSAWLSGSGDTWTYHCPVCTNDKPLDAFDYWRFNKGIGVEDGKLVPVTGWEWVQYAKDWLKEHGVEPPDLNTVVEDLKKTVGEIKELPPPPELNLLNLDESIPWHDRLEQACRVLLQQDRESIKVYYTNEIRTHFNITESQLRTVCNDVNNFKRENPTHIGDLVFDQLGELSQKRNSPGISGYKTGLVAIDKIINGFNNDDFVVVAAPSSAGKTLLLKQFALYVASKYKESEEHRYIPHVFISAESDTSQIINRLICQDSFVLINKIINGETDDLEWTNIMSAAQRIAQSNLFIDGTPNISTSQIRHKLLRLKEEYGTIGSIFIDHFNVLAKPFAGDDNSSYNQIADELNIIRKEFECPLILGSQLTNSHESRNDHRPTKYDLLYGKKLAQNLDKLLMLYHPSKWEKNDEKEGIVQVYVTKNRDGATGMVELEHDFAHMLFKDIPGNESIKPIIASPPSPKVEKKKAEIVTVDHEEEDYDPCRVDF